MPKRRAVVVAVVAVVGAPDSRLARACPIFVPDPICASVGRLAASDVAWQVEESELAAAERSAAKGDAGPVIALLRRIDPYPYVYEKDETFEAVKARLLAALPDEAEGDPRVAAIRALESMTGSARLERLDALRAAAPDSAEMAEFLADAFEREQRPLSARAVLEGFVVDHPRDTAGIHNLLELEWVTRRTARAHELATRWRALEPSNPAALLHEFATAGTVEPDPDVEGRAAELARATDDADLLFAACESLAGARRDRCVLVAHGLIAWRDTPHRGRLAIISELYWRGDFDQVLALLEAESDPAQRAALVYPFAGSIGEQLDCSRATAFASLFDDPAQRRRILGDACTPRPDPNVAFAAAIEAGEMERADELIWRAVAAGGSERAVRAVRARLEGAPEDEKLWWMLSYLTLDPEGDEQVLRDWTEAAPGADEPWYSLAENAASDGRSEEAAELFRAALARADAEEQVDLVSNWLDQLAWASRDPDFESFVRDVQSIVPARSEMEPILRLAEALAARAAGRSEAALALLPEARGEDDWRFENLERELLAELGREQELVAQLRTESMDSSREQWPEVVAQMAAGYGLARLARENYRLALERDPGNPGLWSALATLESSDDRPAAAIDAFVQALSLAPEGATVRSELAALYVEEGRWQEALATLVEHTGAEEYLAGDLIVLTRAARRAGDRFLATEALEHAERFTADSIDARFERVALDAAVASTSSVRARFAALEKELGTGMTLCAGICDPLELRAEARAYLERGPAALSPPR